MSLQVDKVPFGSVELVIEGNIDTQKWINSMAHTQYEWDFHQAIPFTQQQIDRLLEQLREEEVVLDRSCRIAIVQTDPRRYHILIRYAPYLDQIGLVEIIIGWFNEYRLKLHAPSTIQAKKASWPEEVRPSLFASEPFAQIPFISKGASSNSFSWTEERCRLEGIQLLSKRWRISTKAVFLAVWRTLLQRYNYSDEIVFVVRNGAHYSFPMTINTNADDSFKQIAVQVEKHLQLSPNKAETLPIAQWAGLDHWVIVEEGDLKQSLYSLSSEPIGADFEIKSVEHQPPLWPLNVTLRGDGVHFRYRSDRIPSTCIQQMVEHLRTILSAITQTEKVPVQQIRLTNYETNMPSWMRGRKTDYPQESTIHSLFKEQVVRTPDQPAVVYDGQQLTYQELDRRSNQVAHLLRQQGVGREKIVGILVHPSLDMLVGLLGILKAGAAFLPIDPSFPQNRIQFLLQDSEVDILLTQQHLLSHTGSFSGLVYAIDVAANWLHHPSTALDNCNQSRDLAYVIYTSGSTGKPKGVMIEHRSLVNLCFWHNRTFGVTFHDRSAKIAGFSFDASVWELFPYLIQGASIYMVDHQIRSDLHALHQFFGEQAITISFMPTQLAEQFMHLDQPSLRYLLVGGDRLHQIKPQSYQIINNYGPTENTVVTTSCRVAADSTVIPIGTPLDNQEVLILDRYGNMQPVGVPGELCVAGAGLARGYFNQPERTATSFVAHPFRVGQRMYRTGDLASWLPNGQIAYHGRIDQQVKIRGYRVEVGEIESILQQQEGIQEAVVVPYQDEQEDAFLVAYIVGLDEARLPEIRKQLALELPEYMIPSNFIGLEQLPITANGKIDQAALPKPERRRINKNRSLPLNPIEEKLVSIWEEILQVESIGVDEPFLSLGGHSLKANRLVTEIAKEWSVQLPVHQVFSHPTIRALALRVQEAKKEIYQPIRKTDKQTYYPVTSAQKRIYALQQLEGIDCAYHTPALFRMEGRVDPARLQNALRLWIQRHDSLRTSFHLQGGELVQRIHPEVEFELALFQAKDDAEEQQWADQLLRPFSLEEAPLVRAGLISRERDHHLLIIDLHHMIFDGISMGILHQELSALYQGQSLAPLAIQYPDYAVWQEQKKNRKDWQQKEQYWLEQLAGELPVLDLPTDFPRPPMQQFHGERVEIQIHSSIRSQLQDLCLSQQTSLYSLLLSAYYVLLAKYSGQHEMLVGSMVAGRDHADLHPLVGMFVKTLVMRGNPSPERTFLDFLAEVHEQVGQAHEYADYPLEHLLEKITWKRDPSRNPLFDTVFLLQNMDLPNLHIPDWMVTPQSPPPKALFDLTWEVFDQDGLRISIEYNTRLFRGETIQRMAKHYEQILQQIVDEPSKRLSSIALITHEEEKRVHQVFNQTSYLDQPYGSTVVTGFAKQVKANPHHIALVDGAKQVTYAELDQQAQRLAHQIRKRGLGKEQVVALLAQPSWQLIVGILGVLKAGSAYLPIDPAYPDERIHFLLEDSQADYLLIDDRVQSPMYFEGEVSRITDLLHAPAPNEAYEPAPQDLAYVIYTSGSTGKPKGVMVEHQSLLNLCIWHNQYYQVNEMDRSTKFAGVGFDASVWEIFPYLLAGAQIHIIAESMRYDPVQLNHYFESQGITISFLPTQFAEQFCLLDNQSLRALLVGGDRLRPIQPTRYRIYNNYGPTENTVVATTYPVLNGCEKIPIGKPIFNNRVYILDEHNHLQPIGIPGELCIAGKSLARGYLHQPELTKERFVEDPFFPGQRMYRTGDQARWLADGHIEFMGRLDDQVKIRGYRIELGEIETQIGQHPMIEEAVVLAHELDGNTELCAYYVSRDRKTTQQELQQMLRKTLPDYMIPVHWREMDSLPLTANGKVDRGQLPIPERKQGDVAQDDTPPSTQAEIMLVEAWKEVLGVDYVSIHDPFFSLGGDSIKAIQIAARLSQKQVRLEINTLFQYPTIAELAPHLQTLDRHEEQGVVKGPVELTPIQRWFFDQSIPEVHHWNQAMILFRQTGWNRTVLETTWKALVEHHDALRMSYQFEPNGVTQTNQDGNGEFFCLTELDLRNQENWKGKFADEMQLLQRSLHLVNGPLVALGLFQTHEGDYLSIVIHHLVMDGVSWRILMDDLQNIYQQIEQGEMVQLPPKSSSFQRWANELYEYSHSKQLLDELPYWQEIEGKGADLSIDELAGDRKDCLEVTLTFSVESTQQLLTEAQEAYHTEINDLLISGLGLAWKKAMSQTRLLLQLEGHGREPIIEGLDLSRTIGWFTSVFPVFMDLAEEDLSSMIKKIKETLHAIPNKGIGYGILRYMSHQLSNQFQPPVSFNYLGQFDKEGLAHFEVPIGDLLSPFTKVIPLEINGMVIDEQLRFTFTYHPAVWDSTTIDTLVAEFYESMQQLIEHCLSQGESVWTPSDFSASDISIDELDSFLDTLK